MRGLTLLLAIVAAALTNAQTGRLFPTVDAIVAGTDTVYAGMIKKLSFGEEDPLHTYRCRFVVAVDETIKGAKANELEIEFMTSFPKEFYEDLAKKETQFLWVATNIEGSLQEDLLRKMGVRDDPAPKYTWFGLFDQKVERYADFDHNVFTTDLRVISTWKDLLAEARSAARKYPTGRMPTIYFAPPNPVARLCGDPNAYAAVVAPVSPETEALGRRLLEEPQKVVDNALRKSRRVYQKPKLVAADLQKLQEAGVRILASFPSQRNRELLESHLTDEGLRRAIEYALKDWSR